MAPLVKRRFPQNATLMLYIVKAKLSARGAGELASVASYIKAHYKEGDSSHHQEARAKF